MQEIVSSERNRHMKEAYKAMRYLSVMVVSCILALVIGNWLDTYFQTSPWILLGLLAYAIFASLYMLVKGLGE